MSTMRRSMLFIPGNNPSMIMNGRVFGSDSVIYDLEDAVSPKEKDAARILVRNILKKDVKAGVERVVRINSLDTNFWKEDLRQILPADIDVVLLPKAQTKMDIIQLEQEMLNIAKELELNIDGLKIMPLIETALGVENAFEIAAASKRVTALFLGAEDLTADLGAKRSKEGQEIFYSRSRLVVAAKANEIGVIDTPFTNVEDYEGLEKDTNFAKDLGFTGKSIISPRHIDRVNEIFTPSLEEYEYAKRVLRTIERAEKEGKGVVALDGKMIDAPIVNRAKKVVETWNEVKGGF